MIPYYEITVVIAYREIGNFEVKYTAFKMEDTDCLSQLKSFMTNIKSNLKIEVIGIEMEKEEMDFKDVSDPHIINTVH